VTTQPVEVVDAGAAWFEPAPSATSGTVCGVFRRAVYVRFGSRLLAICQADVASGPLHLRLSALPAVALGGRVVFEGGRLEAGSVTVEVAPDHRWDPAPVAAEALRHLARGAPDPDLGKFLPLVARRDLAGLARLVGGRGPGLTPAGDDLLAGVLVIDALLHLDHAGPRRAAVAAVITTDVAAAFLRWAAVGQCIQPFHRVVSALAEGRPAREAEARAELRATGASSGDALLQGLDLALLAAP
jgi:hypothetical protein